MEILTEDQIPIRTKIILLPFVNHSASDYHTIYTTSKYILDDRQAFGYTTIVVTFNQPVYFKLSHRGIFILLL